MFTTNFYETDVSSFFKGCFFQLKLFFVCFSELTCPGDCSNAGICDTSSGQCSCDTGRHGPDCSSKQFSSIQLSIKYSFWLMIFYFWWFASTEFDCPGDGTCSDQGTCDDATGTCVCFQGFERLSGTCKGNFFYF